MTEQEKQEVPLDMVLEDNFGTVGFGKLDDDLPDDYLHVSVSINYLSQLVETAELIGWDTATLSLLSNHPVLLRENEEHDGPVLVVAPRVPK